MAKKGYNQINYLKRCKIIIGIVNTHYREGYTTYSGIFKTFVAPLYPMSYKSFMKIVNMPNIDRRIKEEEERVNNTTDDPSDIVSNQLDLFE